MASTPEAGYNRIPGLSIDLSVPVVRRTPKIIPPPNSPTKSVVATILDDSQLSTLSAKALRELSRPRLPELERNPPLRHPQHKYTRQVELLPEEKDFRNGSLDFFDMTDSSEADEVIEGDKHTVLEVRTDEDLAGQPVPDSSTLDNMNDERQSKSNIADLPFDLTSSQIAEYLRYADIDRSNPADQFDGSIHEQHLHRPVTQDYGNGYFDQNQASQPILQHLPGGSDVADPAPWQLSAVTNNLNGQQFPELRHGDRILSLYNITLQSILAHERSTNSTDLGSQFHESHYTAPISPATHPVLPQTNASQPPSRTNSEYVMVQLPPMASSSRKFRPVSNPAISSSKKSVTILPLPLRNLPSRGKFSPPEISTPYPYTTPTSVLGKSSAPYQTTKSHLLRQDDRDDQQPLSSKTYNPTSQIPASPIRLKHIHFPSPLSPPPPSPSASKPTLTLSVHRKYSHNGLLTRQLPISAAVASSTAPFPHHHHNKHEATLATLDFDDTTLFRQLRTEYYGGLLGGYRPTRWWRRWCSARCLKRIAVIGGEASAPEGGVLALEERLWGRFQRPRPGKGRYAWIHFLQRLAVEGAVRECGDGSRKASDLVDTDPGTGMEATAQTTAQVARSASPRSNCTYSHPRDCNTDPRRQWPARSVPPGLEFIEGWSAARVALAVLLVLLCCIAVVLCWVLLGPAQADGKAGRVGTALAMGVLVLLLGFGMVVAWVGLSWVLM